MTHHLGTFEGRRAARRREAARRAVRGIAATVALTVATVALGICAGIQAAYIGRTVALPYQVQVIDSSGNAYIAGEGSSCVEAWRFAVIPADWHEIACRQADAIFPFDLVK